MIGLDLAILAVVLAVAVLQVLTLARLRRSAPAPDLTVVAERLARLERQSKQLGADLATVLARSERGLRALHAPAPPLAVKTHASGFRLNSEEVTGNVRRRISVCETDGCKHVVIEDTPLGEEGG